MNDLSDSVPASFVLIGNESIVIRCAEILRDRGQRLGALISTGTSAKSWAAAHDVPYIDRRDDFVTFLSETPFDYLFSLANPSILPDAILNAARKYAINCHNSYLPRYGGVHATAWAILQGESSHGITWHRMVSEIDAGDVLLRVPVDVAPDETTFTLDGKCFEVATRSFPQVLDALDRDPPHFQAQDLEQRTYYARRRRPVPGCLLDWRRPAAALDGLTRALNFGAHDNSLGLAKIAIADRFLTVQRLDVRDGAPTVPPGTLMAFDADSLTVATATSPVVIRGLHTLGGLPLIVSELVEHHALAVGQVLPTLDETMGECLMELESALVRHEPYWVKRLADLRPPDFLRTSVDSAQGSGGPQVLRWRSPAALAQLEPRTEEADQPSASSLLGIFAAFVGRLTGAESFDLAWRRPDLGPELASVDGLFARYVPLRVELDASICLATMRTRWDAQLERIRRRRFHPLDLVQRYPRLRGMVPHTKIRLSIGVELRDDLDSLHSDDRDADLTLVVAEGSDACAWIFDPERIGEEQIAEIQGQLSIFIERAVAAPEAPLVTLPLLSDAALERALVAWNKTVGAHDYETCAHHLFEAQVARTPDAPALRLGTETLSYAQLNQRANRWAHYLRDLGVGPEVAVGLFVERSFEMFVGLLAVLKAGGAYLPLDPTYPAERIQLILDDAGAQILLTQEALHTRLPQHPISVLTLDAPPAGLEDLAADNPETEVAASNLAYLIYTSGSTGRPKGVLVEHRSVANLAAVLADAFGVEGTSRVLQFASFGFDTSVAEIWMALSVGAELCLADWRDLLPGPELLALLRAHRISHAALPPSTLAVLPNESLPDLRVLISSGEACTADLITKWSTDQRRIFNGYGPTETTVCATLGRCAPDGNPPPIGRPIANTQSLILDRWLNVVPVGTVGELHVGGVNLARGYHGLDEQTRAAFIAHPYDDAPGARLYKTGDLCRYLPDGRIAFIGRRDNQVKIRGFRIEIEEVETVLADCPALEQVAVTVSERRGHKGLVAYVVAADPQDADPEAWRQFASRRLPEYMIPERFVQLEALPITANGKVDRRRLPEQAPVVEQRAAPEPIAPSGNAERDLSDLWRAVLGRESVSLDANFFDQGGNSLLSLQLVERVNARFGTGLPVVALYQFPTIRLLAEHLSRIGKGAPRVAVPQRPAVSTGGPAVRDKDIAIVAMAGRFPKASSPEALWHNLRSGLDCITFFSDEELSEVSPDLLQRSDYVKAKGIIEQADRFDPMFFGMTPVEAQVMDPQHRLFLEVAHETLERSGHAPDQFDGSIGVFGGCGFTSYLVNNLVHRPESVAQVGELVQVLSNDKDYMSTRVAYKLDLTGPSISLGTACSTSLVAVIHAVNSLRIHQCDMALAGGVTIDVPIRCGYLFEEEGMHSPDGRCRPFDAKAQGTVMSNGVAMVALRRLEDALRDGDPIQAVIRGVGINNDGARKVSFSAPGVGGQAAAIAMAHADADVAPADDGLDRIA
ncbi:MAG: amino acid adenylation domain-containing protein, partial [Acidobacteriota bacterium]